MRRVCLIVVIALLVCFTWSALASSAIYNDGYLTVSTERTGFFEIHVDGRLTYRWVGDRMPVNTFKFALSEGTHTVTLYSPDTGAVTNITIVVGESGQNNTSIPDSKKDEQTSAGDNGGTNTDPDTEKENKVEYPDKPFTIISTEYVSGAITYSFYGLHGYAEIFVDGENTGRIVRKNGEHKLNMELEEGVHELKLYAVKTNELVKTTFDVDNKASINSRYEIKVVNADEEEMEYSLEYEDNKLIIRIENFQETKKITYPATSLNLMQEDGFTQLTIISGDKEFTYRIEEIISLNMSILYKDEDMQVLTVFPSATEETMELYAFSESNSLLYEIKADTWQQTER